jgi:hypothetical protein
MFISFCIDLRTAFPAFRLSNTAFCLLASSMSASYSKKEKL